MAEHTPTPWYVLEVMGKKFLAAKPTPDHPYFQKTRNMDIVGDEDYPRKDADLAFIVEAVNPHERLLAENQRLREALLKLANEASGFRSMADINRHGVTNMRVLGDRITAAFDVLARAALQAKEGSR